MQEKIEIDQEEINKANELINELENNEDVPQDLIIEMTELIQEVDHVDQLIQIVED